MSGDDRPNNPVVGRHVRRGRIAEEYTLNEALGDLDEKLELLMYAKFWRRITWLLFGWNRR